MRWKLPVDVSQWDVVRFAPYYGMFFIWSLGTGAQQLARPLFAHELGAGIFSVILITASNSAAQVASAPLTGLLTDRIGRKPLVLIGNFIRGVTCLLQFFVQDYWQFFITEFVGALGVAMWSTSSSVVMADLTNVDNRGRLLALRSMTTRLGIIAGPATGALIIVLFLDNIRYVFLFNAVTKIFIHVLIYYLAKETAPEGNRRGAEAQQGKLDLSFFLTRAFFALMITSFSLNMMGQTGAFGALFPVQAKDDIGLSGSEVGGLISLAGVVGLVVAYPSGWAVDRWGRKATLIPGLLLLAGAAFVLASLDTLQQAYIMIGLYGLGSTMSMGASQAFAVDLAPPDRRGSFLGIWTLIGSLGSIFAPLLIGAIAANAGYGPGYLLVAGLLVASALFMVVFGPETRSRATRQPEALGTR